MVVARIELKSAVSRDRDALLGVVEIANVGGTATRGNYAVHVYGKGGKKLMHRGVVSNFRRKRRTGVDLLWLGLTAALGEKALELLEEVKNDGGRSESDGGGLQGGGGGEGEAGG